MNASKLSGNASTHVGLAIASLLAIGGAFLACGGDDKGGTSSDDDDSTTGKAATLTLRFSPMYSAYDGEHEFKLPVVAQGVDSNTGKVGVVRGATFKAADSSKVSIENTEDGAMLTMKGAGDVKITATKDGASATATLHIAQATPDQYESGKARYNNMTSALTGTGLMAFMSINRDGACTTCHGQTAMIFKVMHTPQQTGGYSDEDLKTIFTMGNKPEGYEQRSGIPECLWGMGHQWNVPDVEGLIVYLRSIPPQSQGCFDFPTPNAGDGGFMIPPGLFGGGGASDSGACGALPIPANICSIIEGFRSADGGFNFPGLGDGGFRFPGLGDGGFRIPGLGGGDAGTGSTTPPATSSDAGTTTPPATTGDAG